jgi:hypothetical protein
MVAAVPTVAARTFLGIFVRVGLFELLSDSLVAGSTQCFLIRDQKRSFVGGMWIVTVEALPRRHKGV